MRSFGLAVALAVLALAASPALAADPLTVTGLSPTGRLAVAPMTDVSFSAKLEVPVETAYVRVSAAPPGPDGVLEAVIAGGQMSRRPFSERLAWGLPAISPIRMKPGTYWWQVVGLVSDASGVRQLVGPVQRVELHFPSSWSRRGQIDRRFGRHGRTRFLLSTRGIPQGVDRARLRTIVAVSARRWGLRLTGWTSRAAGVGDRTNVAGFGTVPSAGALALQVDRYVGRVRTDQDLIIRPDIPWALGPARPTTAQYDLETALIHELGHMAGNKKHTPRWSNGPMGASLARGEWWRTPHDWYRRGCPLSAPRDLL